MEERRESERRNQERIARFPLRLSGRHIKHDRRYLPSRRLNDIAIKEVECMDYISEIIKQEK